MLHALPTLETTASRIEAEGSVALSAKRDHHPVPALGVYWGHGRDRQARA